MRMRATRASATGCNQRRSLTQQYRAVLASLRASGATVRNQLVQDQWAYQQRMLALYPGDASKCLLFQDSAGATPAAIGQLVGLRLDYETAGQRGPEQSTVQAASPLALSGNVCLSANSATANKLYEVSFDYAISVGSVQANIGNIANILRTGVGTFRAFVKPTAAGAIAIGCNGATGTVSNFSVREIPGAHMLQATSTKRPILRQDANGAVYLDYDGIDDAMQSASTVDLTGTDEISVFAPVLKESDAATAVIFEFSAEASGISGAVGIYATQPGAAYLSRSRGSAFSDALSSGFVAPNKALLTQSIKIGADKNILRANGVQAAQNTADQGAGNYGNHVLYEGARAASSLYFTGQSGGYLLIDRLLTPYQQAVIERYINSTWRAF